MVDVVDVDEGVSEKEGEETEAKAEEEGEGEGEEREGQQEQASHEEANGDKAVVDAEARVALVEQEIKNALRTAIESEEMGQLDAALRMAQQEPSFSTHESKWYAEATNVRTRVRAVAKANKLVSREKLQSERGAEGTTNQLVEL